MGYGSGVAQVEGSDSVVAKVEGGGSAALGWFYSGRGTEQLYWCFN